MRSLLSTRHLQVLVLRYTGHGIGALSRYELSNGATLAPRFTLVSVRIEPFFTISLRGFRRLVWALETDPLGVLELLLAVIVEGEIFLHGLP